MAFKKSDHSRPLLLAIFLAFAAIVSPVRATEGALGKTITGTSVASFAGVVPPTPGFSLALGYAHYSGRIDASREVPVAGLATLGLDATFSLYDATGLFVWNTGEGRWNFASMLTVPFADIDADVLAAAGPITRGMHDQVRGKLFDISFEPIIAGYHIDANRHVSLSLNISAPTGDYQIGRLANPSLNTWVYTPTVSYTQLIHEKTLEWSTTTGVDIYSNNDATDYQSGAVFHVDSLLVQRFANGWGIGAIGSWVQQLQDDSGPTADRLDGFKGHALGLGPVASYTKRWDGGQVEFSARWLKEFDVKNRLRGDPLLVTAAVSF